MAVLSMYSPVTLCVYARRDIRWTASSSLCSGAERCNKMSVTLWPIDHGRIVAKCVNWQCDLLQAREKLS